ncbi:MAG TPA: DNA-binding protein [Lachnospiraceae bacterium]|jgi:transcriptional regulator with XRE-family HTH domain|nr:DNA-binding protein [Lachnospiraceae bacterium]HBY72601.1 DNA-binding protein [Lachnospiraceae bacterium]HCA69736.1 DNA-binding protein [Lachnospiraceae bacterium]HCM12849.1 DNA-binding protein [Lachnospiraceae bacterium]HCR41119.1 DNA-binding protein [Lachnospiraceae bacterium]
MSKFIDNVNEYLAVKKIKRTYISLKSGIEANKLSRILNEVQEATTSDMEKIAYALGEKIEFFIGDNISISNNKSVESLNVAFYAGEPKAEQQEFALKLIDFLENLDAVLGVEKRLSTTNLSMRSD